MKCDCVYCNGNPTYHQHEAERIAQELETLGPQFLPHGIVRTILKERIDEETRKGI